MIMFLFFEKGMILMIVLLFLQMLSLLGIYAIESSLLSVKMNRQEWEHHIFLFDAKNQLLAIEKTLDPEKITCLIPITSTDDLLQKNKRWWKLMGCTGDHYFYVVEDEGVDACAMILHSKKKVAHYFRLMGYFFQDDANELFLQSTFVLPIEQSQSCEATMHDVSVGQQFSILLSQEA